MKNGDKLVYIGESNEDFDYGHELTLMEDLSEAAIAVLEGRSNTPEEVKLQCMYFGGKRGIAGGRLIPIVDLKLKEDEV